MLFKKVGKGFAAIESGTIEVGDVEVLVKELNRSKCFLQLCSLSAVCCPMQVFAALDHAIGAAEADSRKTKIANQAAPNSAKTAKQTASKIAKNIGLEFLLRLAATRQIGKALDLVGLRQGKQEALAVAHAATKAKAANAIASLRKLGFSAKPALLKKARRENEKTVRELYSIIKAQTDALSGTKDALCSAAVESIAMTSLPERK